jgi:hypothetical protein
MAYEPEPRKCDRKDWIYERYWGEDMRSLPEIANETEHSLSLLVERMSDFGIPRRLRKYSRNSSVSPFAGFYGNEENAPTDEQSRTYYEEEKQDEYEFDWSSQSARVDKDQDKTVFN